jgi:hypothetical protein
MSAPLYSVGSVTITRLPSSLLVTVFLPHYSGY